MSDEAVFDAHAINGLVDLVELGFGIDDAELGVAVQNRGGDVGADALQGDDAMAFAIFRDHADALRHGGTRGVDLDRFAVQPEFGMGLAGVAAENGHGQFGTSGADQPGDAEDFAFAQFEGDVVDAFCVRDCPHPGR